MNAYLLANVVFYLVFLCAAFFVVVRDGDLRAVVLCGGLGLMLTFSIYFLAR